MKKKLSKTDTDTSTDTTSTSLVREIDFIRTIREVYILGTQSDKLSSNKWDMVEDVVGVLVSSEGKLVALIPYTAISQVSYK